MDSLETTPDDFNEDIDDPELGALDDEDVDVLDAALDEDEDEDEDSGGERYDG